MPKPKTKGPGRPRLPGERLPLGLRVTREAKRKLDLAATASGRSQSQEAELRLEHTFNEERAVLDVLDLAYGRRWTGLLLALAHVGQLTGTRGVFVSRWNIEGCEDWLSDPYAYDQMVRAVNFILEAFRPKDTIVMPHELFGLPAAAFERVGEGFAHNMLAAVIGSDGKDANDPVVQSIRRRLGDLTGNVRISPNEPAKPTKKTSRQP